MLASMRVLSWLGPALLLAIGSVGCGLQNTPLEPGAQVVAAENFWGSIATQLAGDKLKVASIITNPNTDPHSYEATPEDAKTFARAQFVIVNGAGYDAWADKLLEANPVPARNLLNDLLQSLLASLRKIRDCPGGSECQGYGLQRGNSCLRPGCRARPSSDF